MMIAIPVNENSENAGICVSFGRAPFFLFHDTETGKSTSEANAAANAQGGAGIKAAQFIADKGAEAVITPRCGENAAQVLQAAGIKIYKSSGSDAGQNLADLKVGKLELLSSFHAGFHGRQ